MKTVSSLLAVAGFVLLPASSLAMAQSDDAVSNTSAISRQSTRQIRVTPCRRADVGERCRRADGTIVVRRQREALRRAAGRTTGQPDSMLPEEGDLAARSQEARPDGMLPEEGDYALRMESGESSEMLPEEGDYALSMEAEETDEMLPEEGDIAVRAPAANRSATLPHVDGVRGQSPGPKTPPSPAPFVPIPYPNTAADSEPETTDE